MIDKELMDSDEEKEFYEWLLEAEKFGLVSEIEYHEHEFELSEKFTMKVEKKLKTKTKIVDKFLLHPHKYTPDFVFKWHGDKELFIISEQDGNCYVDIKGSFGKWHDDKQFSVNQKWVYKEYNIFVNKVVPSDLFIKTWVPESCRLSPKLKKPRKKFVHCLNIGQYLGN